MHHFHDVFHEKRTRSWYLTLAFALAAILFMAVPSPQKEASPSDSNPLIENEM